MRESGEHSRELGGPKKGEPRRGLGGPQSLRRENRRGPQRKMARPGGIETGSILVL